jgi:hypothetical protein
LLLVRTRSAERNGIPGLAPGPRSPNATGMPVPVAVLTWAALAWAGAAVSRAMPASGGGAALWPRGLCAVECGADALQVGV